MLVTVENKMATNDPFLSTALPACKEEEEEEWGRNKQGLLVENRRGT